VSEYTPGMAEPCLFCDNNSGSREHLWPKWIHERVDFGPLKMDRYKSEQIIIPNPQFTVKSVCGICNNGWMSNLEGLNVPIIGSILNDISITLDRGQQNAVAAWAVKTAMILDSTRPKEAGDRFYLKSDCVRMRESLTMPLRTRVWIGRIESKHLLSLGTDYRYMSADYPEPRMLATITTLVTGHFATQIIAERPYPKFADLETPYSQPKGGNWGDYLIQIWPIQREWITWPPKNSFTNGGPNGIAYLMDRWRIGTPVDPDTFAIKPS